MFIVKQFRFPDGLCIVIILAGDIRKDRQMTSRSLPISLTTPAATLRGTAWTGWLRRILQGIESRRHLAEMDGRMLADIGVSRSEALEEARRAPWDLTPRRR